MLLFGFANPEKMEVKKLVFSNETPTIGEDILFEFELNVKTNEKQKVRLEYIVYFVKNRGKTSPKVFQLKEVVLEPGIHKVVKKHSFKNLSTRKHYTGLHKFELVINGEVKAEKNIQLI